MKNDWFNTSKSLLGAAVGVSLIGAAFSLFKK